MAATMSQEKSRRQRILVTEGEGQEAREKKRRETKQNTNEKVALDPVGFSVPFWGALEANAELPGLHEITDPLI